MTEYFQDVVTKFSPKNKSCVDRGIIQGNKKNFKTMCKFILIIIRIQLKFKITEF